MSDFDRDMEEYITERRRRSFLGVFSRKQAEVRLHPEVQPYADEAEPVPPTVQPEPQPEPAPQESEQPLPEPKEGFFSRMFKKKEEEQAPVISNEMYEDLRQVSKIALHIAKQLPSDKLEELKKSAEYSQFKDILKKHGLIR